MIREVTEADEDALLAMLVQARLRAYADYLTPEDLDEAAAARRLGQWRAQLAAEPATPGTMLVDDEAGTMAGVVAVACERGGGATGRGELTALYVAPHAQGAGVGSRLLGAGEDALRARGFSTATLWVYEGNGLARTFYARHGWVEEPREAWAHLHGDDWAAPALRMRRSL